MCIGAYKYTIVSYAECVRAYVRARMCYILGEGQKGDNLGGRGRDNKLTDRR